MTDTTCATCGYAVKADGLPLGWLLVNGKPYCNDHRTVAKIRAEAVTSGACPQREDGIHCVHWWDDAGPCCNCGDDTPPERSDTRDANGGRLPC